MSSSSLADLLQRAREGDSSCREQLFESCRSYLGLLARAQVDAWLRAKVDASDLVQQTMLEAYRDFSGFEGRTEGEWLTWLRRILTRNAADFVRHYRGTAKRQIKREVALRHPGDPSDARAAPDPAAPGESPSQFLIKHDRQLQVAAALDQLSEDHREVIILRNLERLPFDEVARRMGRSRPAVQMLWMRAIRKLQEEMGAEK